MKLTILGSGTNRISLKRSSPSYLLESNGRNILIDAGSGCAKQLLKIKKHILDIDAILFSHFHKDHYLELPVILNEFKSQRFYPEIGEYPRKKVRSLKIYGPQGIIKIVGQDKKDISCEVKTVNNAVFKLFGLKIRVLPLSHAGPIIGYRFEYKSKIITFTSDSKYCANSVLLSKKADLLIHSAGLPEAFKVKIHATPVEAGRAASEAMVKRLVLTHFYPVMEKYNLKGQARKYYKGPIILAKDLMKFKI